jgi:hypothetical protein
MGDHSEVNLGPSIRPIKLGFEFMNKANEIRVCEFMNKANEK